MSEKQQEQDIDLYKVISRIKGLLAYTFCLLKPRK